jgi:hypothetical protein
MLDSRSLFTLCSLEMASSSCLGQIGRHQFALHLCRPNSTRNAGEKYANVDGSIVSARSLLESPRRAPDGWQTLCNWMSLQSQLNVSWSTPMIADWLFFVRSTLQKSHEATCCHWSSAFFSAVACLLPKSRGTRSQSALCRSPTERQGRNDDHWGCVFLCTEPTIDNLVH